MITTSPPNSMHLLGASVKRLTGIPWVADFRDAVLGNADRRFDKASVRAKEKALEQVVRLVARSADGIVAVSEPIADEVRSFEPVGQVRVIPNGCDFDDFAGLEYHKGERFRITHTGSFFGQRNPRPFLTALAESGLDDVVARFAGDFRAADREWVEELGLGEKLELLDYVPHREALELQRDSEANLLLLPEAAGRGRVVPSGKIFEYLAAERPILAAVPPDGAAAELVRETGAGVVVAPDDERGLREALAGLHARWRAGKLADGVLSPEQRKKLSRETRVQELAELLWSLRNDARVQQGAACGAVPGGAGLPARPSEMTGRHVFHESREGVFVSFFFLAAVFCASFEKVQWNVAGTVFLADLTALGFLASFAFDRIGSHRLSGRVPRTAAVLLAFLGAFLLVYLIGFFNLETTQALSQFGKGIVKWLIHFAFLIVGVIYLTGRSTRYFWRTLAWFLGGIVVQRRLRDPAAPLGAGRATTSTRSSSRRSRAARARSTSTARSTARASTGRTRSPATRTTSGSCCCSRS